MGTPEQSAPCTGTTRGSTQKNATPEGVALIEKSTVTYLKAASASATVLETRETIW